MSVRAGWDLKEYSVQSLPVTPVDPDSLGTREGVAEMGLEPRILSTKPHKYVNLEK